MANAARVATFRIGIRRRRGPFAAAARGRPLATMPRPTRLTIAAAADFDFPRVVCSYGYFLLSPNAWRPAELELARRFDAAEFGLPSKRFLARIRQPGGRGGAVRVVCDVALPRDAAAALRRAIVRMLRVDADLARWRRLCPAARRRGFGRMFRSPTLWEDMVKTITSCNVAWPNTVRMNALLVDRVGAGAFPSPEVVARWTSARLRRACKVGYRAPRILGLARRFARGDLDPSWFESPNRTTDALRETLLAIDGFGPYAAANVLQLLGHDDHLPIDTETYRHYCRKTGVERPRNPKELDARIEAHYERFRPHRFLAYWFELWRDYERRHGDAWTWEPELVGTAFTASRLQDEPPGERPRSRRSGGRKRRAIGSSR